MILVDNRAVREALPVIYAAVRAAKSEHRLLVVNAEATRLLRMHPELRVPPARLAEEIIRLAASSGVPLQIG